jgi:hypothetical protein
MQLLVHKYTVWLLNSHLYKLRVFGSANRQLK